MQNEIEILNRETESLKKRLFMSITNSHQTTITSVPTINMITSKIKLKTFFRNKNVQKEETELANKEPNIKSKTNWKPEKNHRSSQ